VNRKTSWTQSSECGERKKGKGIEKQGVDECWKALEPKLSKYDSRTLGAIKFIFTAILHAIYAHDMSD